MQEETKTFREGKSGGKIEWTVIRMTIIMCRGHFSVHSIEIQNNSVNVFKVFWGPRVVGKIIK